MPFFFRSLFSEKYPLPAVELSGKKYKGFILGVVLKSKSEESASDLPRPDNTKEVEPDCTPEKKRTKFCSVA